MINLNCDKLSEPACLDLRHGNYRVDVPATLLKLLYVFRNFVHFFVHVLNLSAQDLYVLD